MTSSLRRCHHFVTAARHACVPVEPNGHLLINHQRLSPGDEWRVEEEAWRFVLVTEGLVYWLRAGQVREINVGEILVLSPALVGTFRASQIGAAQLYYFYFRPDSLSGLLSLSERLSLETLAAEQAPRQLSAADPVSREFQELAIGKSHRRGFFYRCRILHLVSGVFSNTAPGEEKSPLAGSSTMRRFEEVISRIPDSELMYCPSEKLADLCGCSVRHFRRVFRRQFKTSIRSKQTELRLEKARQLLSQTDAKVVSIAQETGYRHLGFFNAAFKKRFGMTPGEWRRRETAARSRRQPS